MKKIFVILNIFLLAITGRRRKACVKGSSIGALGQKDAKEQINKYFIKVKNIIREATGKEDAILLAVGHQLGNYEEYPIFPNQISNWNFKAHQEMHRSFNDINLQGVELDIQLSPDRKEIYIVHEKISNFYKEEDLRCKKEKVFFRNNSFEILIEEFIKKEHYKKRTIFIELKAEKAFTLDGKNEKYLTKTNRNTVTEEEELVVEKAIEIIDGVIKRNTDDEDMQKIIREHIAFVSFNYLAIQKVIEYGHKEENIKQHKLYYIAGSNQLLGKFLSILCPELNSPDELFVEKKNDANYETIWSWVNENNELTGVWLSPNVIKNVVEKLSNINKKREERKLKPFEYYLSTYQYSMNDFFSVIEEPQKKYESKYFYENIKGLIFDIKK